MRKLLQIIFSLSFTLLAFWRINTYPAGYIKFAMLEMIAEYRLVYLYYFFGFIEILLAISIFFVHKRIGRTILDCGLLLYVPWLILYYIILYQSSDGCIECNYTTHFLGEKIEITGFILIVLSAIYLFFLRDGTKARKAQIPASDIQKNKMS